ncbi:MAG: 5'-phosphate synthase pdxT subunit [Myxococcota bacterium]
MHVGVLALQGGVTAHVDMLRGLGHRVTLVRHADALADETLTGLILPGGESSTMLKFLVWDGLEEPLDRFVRSGKPVLATCAGMILCATEVHNPTQRSFGWLDIDVQRNGWGRQLDSFEATADDSDMPLLFIRAPRISRVGEGVEVLASFNQEAILVRAGAVTAASFHPELTGDDQVHRQVFGAA